MWKGYHINEASLLKSKTKENVKSLQSAQKPKFQTLSKIETFVRKKPLIL